MTPTREQFETAMRDTLGRADAFARHDDAPDFYAYLTTRHAWTAWQAARAQALEDAKTACVGIYRAHEKKHPSDYDQGAMNAAEACECAVEALKGKQ